MKILNTIQEVWSRCIFCPICQDVCRNIQVAVGPDEALKTLSFNKENHILHLNCALQMKNRLYRAKFQINCINNTFQSDISDPQQTDTVVDRASTPYFYFYIMGNCSTCNAAFTNSSDLELDMLQGKISNIGIEREGIYLLEQKSKYHVTMCYSSKDMIITKCYEEDDGTIVDDNKPFHFPIIDLDFSNQRKVINKIKTLLVFS